MNRRSYCSALLRALTRRPTTVTRYMERAMLGGGACISSVTYLTAIVRFVTVADKVQTAQRDQRHFRLRLGALGRPVGSPRWGRL